MDYIYKISWYNSPRCTISHTDKYYKDVEHTYWVFEREDCFKVELIKVYTNSIEYMSAVSNSNLHH